MKWGHVETRFGTDDVVFLVGGGPSLSELDVLEFMLTGKFGFVIGINQSGLELHGPLAQIQAIVSIDQQFMGHRPTQLQAIAASGVPVYLCPPEYHAANAQALMPAAHILRDAPAGFSWDADRLHRQGGSSGYAALNAAVLMGAKRIVLLGYDYKRGKDGRKNWHKAYDWPQNENWPAWARRYDVVAPMLKTRGIEVINASPDSAVTAFPRMTIADALAWQWKDAA